MATGGPATPSPPEPAADMSKENRQPEGPETEPSTAALWKAARQMAEHIGAKEGSLRLVGHYDGDGLTSSAILAVALDRAGIPFQLTNVTGLNDKLVRQLAAEAPGRVLFCDMGSGQRGLLGRLASSQVLVVDHHLQQDERPANMIEMNAHELGVDGTYGACGASLALTLAVSLDEANWDLVQPAMAGIIADRQHLPRPRGLNEELVREGVRRGHLAPHRGLALPLATPLSQCLANSLDPYFVGLAGREPAAAKWLKERQLDPAATPEDLDEKRMRRLASELTLALLGQGATPEGVERLFFPGYRLGNYRIDRGSLDASMLAAAVNAAGREGQRALGVAAAMGDQMALQSLVELQETFDARVRQGLMELETKGTTISPRGRFQHFEAGEPTVKGAVAGLAAAYWLCRELPVLALSHREGKLDISSRATQLLVEQGVDLAGALAVAATSCGGQGGGHPIAAGASVDLDRKDEFLAAVDQHLKAPASKPNDQE